MVSEWATTQERDLGVIVNSFLKIEPLSLAVVKKKERKKKRQKKAHVLRQKKRTKTMPPCKYRVRPLLEWYLQFEPSHSRKPKWEKATMDGQGFGTLLFEQRINKDFSDWKSPWRKDDLRCFGRLFYKE